MKIAVGYSDNPDSVAAGLQAAQMALSQCGRSDFCDFVLLFCTARHNQNTLRSAVSSAVGNSQPIFGGGAAGVITNEYFGYAGDQVGVALVWLEDSSYSCICQSGLRKSEIETGKYLGETLKKQGLHPNSSMLLFYDAIDRSNGDIRLLLATWLLDGLKESLGFLPDIMGAGLQGDHSCTPTKQYTGSHIEDDCALALSFSEDICIDSIIMHGCKPASPYYTVTKADGPVILEINNTPAIEFMDSILNCVIPPENYPFFLLLGINHADPWAEYEESNYASRLCLSIDKERQGIVMFEPDMVEGTKFQIMFRSVEVDYMTPKIEGLFDNLGEKEPLFALYIDCAGRCAGYGGMDIEDALVVQKAINKRVPLLGIYTGAEIASIGGRPRGLDLTGVFCLFSKRKNNDYSNEANLKKDTWNNTNSKSENFHTMPLEKALALCEQNAAKVLELDTKSIAIRHELEQKRRGFSLLAELSVTLREGSSDFSRLLTVTQRINAALNMQKTIVLFPDETGEFYPYVLQGYSEEEKESLSKQPVPIDMQQLDSKHPILITAVDNPNKLQNLRNILNLPYLISTPIIVKHEVAAILITGRTIESTPFLSRLGRNDVETVQAIGALLSTVLVYRKLDDANKQAQIDVLTGLLNRGAQKSAISALLSTPNLPKSRFAFFIIDCDYFKDVNDSYGHLEGDTVLLSLADTLKSSFRTEDLIARIGGDEFVVFCQLHDSDSKKDIENRGKSLVQTWQNTPLVTKSGITFHSSVSVGLSFAPSDGNTYEELFRYADIALYKSKQLGRNRCSSYNASTMKDILQE